MRRRRPAARRTSSTTWRWVRISGPASSCRAWLCGPCSSAASTPSAASSAHSGLRAGRAAAGQRHGGQQRQALQPRQPAVAGRVDERGGERRRRDLRRGHRPGGERLGAVHARGVVRRGAERHRPHEVPGARPLGRAQQAPGRERVELLDRRPGLVALGAGQVDHGPHAAQRVAERGRVGEVAGGELHVHPLRPEPARIAHQAAHGLAARDEPPQHRGAEQAGRSREQDHASNPRGRVI